MSSSSLTGADQTAILVLAVIVLLMARRTYALQQGTPYSTLRIFGYGAYSTALFVILAASTIYLAVGSWGPIAYALVGVYAVAIASIAWAVRPRVRRLVRFEMRPDGRLYYRLPVIVPALSLALFVVRVGVQIGLFGLASVATFTLPTSVGPGVLFVLIAADLLFGGSVGLLFGRALGIRGAHGEYATRPVVSPGASETPLR